MPHRPIKISLITATWNCADTISDCLDSVSSQTYHEIEHIVIDGGSKDPTLDVLHARQSQISTLVSEKDRGIYDALNKGISKATGDVIGFLHADDLFADDTVLEKVAAAFEDPSVCAVYGDLQYVKKSDPSRVVRYWRSRAFSSNLLRWGWMPPHPTLYVRREWYQRIGGFDIGYRISADYYSILQLFSIPGFSATYLPFVFTKMRLGGASNKSIKNILLKSREDLNALVRSGVGGIGTLFCKNVSKIGQFLN
ncbi:glycosyltransferase family 2 protein [Zoogloea sp.]|uniref:glycosyltransferase family 2 protein n=1 Tax=Zoogloea sp. TaxID=49181 RepID=UPI0035B4AE34